MDGDVDLGRRAALRNLVLTPTAAALGSMLWGTPEAWANTAAGLMDVDPLVHFLKRTSFGIRPADLTAIRSSGRDAYLETQLGAAPVDDTADVVAKAYFPIAHLPATAYWRTVFPDPKTPANGDIAVHWGLIAGQVVGNAIYRALFSKRQLFEIMVQFWSGHLNTYDPTFKGPEQQTVIRANALGNFRTMIEASQRDTTMSRYLNNGDSKQPTPNQNYARELMELHTLGQGRGYTQDDVIALSAILSGHTWDMDRTSATFGQYLYRPEWHVNGTKTFIGHTIAATGQTEINQAFNIIFAMPECAEFVAFKLCRYFIAETPAKIADIQPGDMVMRTAAVLRNSGYDIPTTLRYILKSPEFAASADQKFYRPFEMGVAMLRAYDVPATEAAPDDLTSGIQDIIVTQYQNSNPKIANDVRTAPVPKGVAQALTNFLRASGNLPGYWPTPDGYPDKGAFWAGATQFITRWNYIAQESERNVAQEKVLVSTSGNTRASHRVPNTIMPARQLVRLMADALLHRTVSDAHETVIAAYIGNGNAEATLSAANVTYYASAVAEILLGSPYGQLC